MAAVTQTIPSYLGGVSKQTDKKMKPGQVRECLNAYPDPTFGLRKRPGFKFIKTVHESTDTASPDFADAKWFFIKRDNEEKYIGCILDTTNADGSASIHAADPIKIWRSDGTACAVTYPDGVSYLDTTRDNYDILTVQDNSVVTNKTKVVGEQAAPTNNEAADAYILGSKATIRLFQVKYSSRYSATVKIGDESFDSEYTTIEKEAVPPAGPNGELVNTAEKILTELENGFNTLSIPGTLTITRLEATLELDLMQPSIATTPTVDGGSGGTEGSYVNKPVTVTKSKILTLGTPSAADPARVEGTYTIGTSDYTTSGIGIDATFSVDVDSSGAATVTLVDAGKHFIATEDITIAGNLGGGADLVIPVATIGAGTGITVDVTIDANGVATSVTINTNGKDYFKDDELTVTAFTGSPTTDITTTVTNLWPKEFEISCSDNQGNATIRSFGKQVNVVSDLPADSIHDRIVKVVNSKDGTAEDTYWSIFSAENEKHGVGYWKESIDPTVSPGMDSSTLPHQLRNTAENVFVFEKAEWVDRKVGDESTNTSPSFVGYPIQQTFFHNNRLGVLSEDNVAMSKSGEFYDFFFATALAQTSSDPIDINCSSIRPAVLHAVIPTAQGLILFSKSQQFILFSDGEILTPTSAVIRGIANYEMDSTIDPVDVGTSINFVSKTPSYTRVFGAQTRGSEESPIVNDISKVVSEWIPDTVTNMLTSPQNFLIALYGPLDNTMYLHKTYTVGDQILMQAWFRWDFPGNIQHAAVDSDSMWTMVETKGKYILASASLTQTPEEEIIVTSDGKQVNPHMDLYGAVSSMTYDATNNLTKCYLPTGYKDNENLTPVLVIAGNGSSNFAGVTESGFTITPNRPTGQDHTTASPYFEVPNKDISGLTAADVIIGYKYNYDVELPKTYFNKNPEGTIKDYAAALTIARMKFAVGLSSVVSFKVKSKGYRGELREFTGDGTTTDFSVPFPLKEENGIIVKLDGAKQASNTYSIVTTDAQATVKFNTAPEQYTVSRLYGGSGYTADTGVSTTSANGTGLTVDTTVINGAITDLTIHGGSNYVEGEIVSVTSLTGGAAGGFKVGPPQKIEITTDTWYDVQPVHEADQYLADDVPLLEEDVFTVPLHQKTENFSLRVFSNSPFPVSLSSMMWEGNYSPRFYRRT